MSGTFIYECFAHEDGDKKRKIVFQEAYTQSFVVGNDGVAKPYAQVVIQALTFQKTGGSWKFVNPVSVQNLLVMDPHDFYSPDEGPAPTPLSTFCYEEQIGIIKEGLKKGDWVVHVTEDPASSLAYCDTTAIPTEFGQLRAVGQVILEKVKGQGPNSPKGRPPSPLKGGRRTPPPGPSRTGPPEPAPPDLLATRGRHNSPMAGGPPMGPPHFDHGPPTPPHDEYQHPHFTPPFTRGGAPPGGFPPPPSPPFSGDQIWNSQ